MIVSIHCNQASFRKVEFREGFNVILADRTKESTRKDSRNGLGKSTLIEILHFCLGSKPARDSALRSPSLENWLFTAELVLGGRHVRASRGVSNSHRVYVDGDTTSWPLQPQTDKKDGGTFFPVRDWNALLGTMMFGLPVGGRDEYEPTFRSCISYFVRRGRDAYTSPFEHYRKQLEWDKQVHTAFLLGLAWEDAAEWQRLRDRENVLKTLRKAAKIGAVRGMLGSIGQLESEKVRVERQITELESNLSEFRIHPQYREIETEANQLTSEIQLFSNKNLADRRLWEMYERSLEEDAGPDAQAIVTMYEAATVSLPQLVLKRLEDVKEFHHLIVRNRTSFLSAEAQRLKDAIAEREAEIKRKDDRRSRLLGILRAHGALDEHTQLQKRLSELTSQREDVDIKIANLRKIEHAVSQIRIDRATLQQKARRNYDDRREQWEPAVDAFSENSRNLYDEPGNLIVDLKESGFHFDVEIERARSQGVSSMKVFCYDLMLAQRWASLPRSPGFLIHDSTIFDGVDERQVALALELAAERSSGQFQYICALNSDTLPTQEFSEDFDFEKSVRLRLTDAAPDESLLGFRF